MNKEELLQLRQQIVDQTKRLALESDANPEEKLQVLMGLVKSGDASTEVMHKAYETAQQLPQDADKMDAFLDLIYEIDARLADESSAAIETQIQSADSGAGATDANSEDSVRE